MQCIQPASADGGKLDISPFLRMYSDQCNSNLDA